MKVEVYHVVLKGFTDETHIEYPVNLLNNLNGGLIVGLYLLYKLGNSVKLPW